ncbi:hypothetical protein ACLK19_22015 [Escherichia coli]
MIRQPTLHQEFILEANKQGIQVATGDGILNLLSLQPAGKKAMSAQDLLNSRREWFVLVLVRSDSPLFSSPVLPVFLY